MTKTGGCVNLICNRCQKEKPTSDFSPRKCRPRGFHYCCKSCAAERMQKRRDTGKVCVDREVAKQRSRLWRKNNPGHRNALKAAYKAAKAGATPTWLSDEQRQNIVSFYDLARNCSVVTGEQYQVDHIIPIRGKSVCGLHVPWNLQVLPASINRRKSNSYEP